MHRFVLLGLTTVLWVALMGCATTGDSPTEMLFVQNADGVSFQGESMTLKRVHPMTIWFSDRPKRFVSQRATKDFVTMWDKGGDSFASDPPNATLSVMERNDVVSVVLELSNPRLRGFDLTYDVEILAGKAPTRSGMCSLFIDSLSGWVDNRVDDRTRDIVDNRVDDRTRDIVDDRVDVPRR